MRRPVAIGVAAIVVAVLSAGCGLGTDRGQRLTLAALSTSQPRLSQSPASPSGPTCRNPTASLRPPAALPGPGALPAGSFMAAIRQRGYLIAGVDQNTLLFAYFNPLDGKLEGFEIDVLRELSQAIFGNPNRIQFRAVTTAERIPSVRSGSVDLVADAVTITCQRRRQVDFSTVYYDAGQRILVPKDSRVRAVGDLVGKRVCATSGSTSLDNVKRLVPRAIPYPVAQRTDCLVALQQGQVDAVTSDDSILLGLKAQDPNTKIVGSSFSQQPYGIAISKSHPDFVRFINGVLARMRSDGRWRSIYSRWLGRFTATPPPPRATYSG
ncbi:MAG TPA: glutamate ABC transporter substrate-binding protein [Solirubrobacteraceae bacterium]